MGDMSPMLPSVKLLLDGFVAALRDENIAAKSAKGNSIMWGANSRHLRGEERQHTLSRARFGAPMSAIAASIT